MTVQSQNQIQKNKDIFFEIFTLVQTTPNLTADQLREKYTELFGKKAPDTTHSWLVESVVRKTQENFYEGKGVRLPDKVRKNNDAFYKATPPPKKDEAPRRKARSKTGGTRRNKVDNRHLTWSGGDEDISKQKKLHHRVMLEVMRDAGEKGILASAMCLELRRRLQGDDLVIWEKHNERTHVSYIVKRFDKNIVVTEAEPATEGA